MSMLQAYLEVTTIHGFRYLSKQESFLGKIIWTPFLILMFGASIYLINESFLSWRENPKVTFIDVIDIDKIPFPDVTVCSRYST